MLKHISNRENDDSIQHIKRYEAWVIYDLSTKLSHEPPPAPGLEGKLNCNEPAQKCEHSAILGNSRRSHKNKPINLCYKVQIFS